MKVSLFDIERAIRANFIINPDGAKYLEADDTIERDMKKAARMVFVAIALNNGHKIEAIRDHIDMDLREFKTLLKKYHAHYRNGYEKASERSKLHRVQYDQGEAFDPGLRVYRKTVLVNNYLNTIKATWLQLY